MRPSYPALPASQGAPGRAQPSLVALDQILSPGMSLAQLWAILRAYRKQAALIAAVALVASALVIKLLPKTYTATATVVLNYEINDPLAGREFPLGLLASYTTTQIEIMQGPQVLVPVIQALDLTRNSRYTSGYSGDGSNLMEWVVQSLRAQLEIRPSFNGGQLIYITASSRVAEEAAAIANRVADTYLNQQVQRVNAPATEQAKRYASQMQELRNNVTRAQERIAEFRRRTGIVDIEGGTDVDMQLMASLEQRYQEAQNQRRVAEVRQTGDREAGGDVTSSSLVQGLKTSLATQRAELAQLRTTFGPKHPKVLERQSEIAAIEKALAREAEGNLSSARQLEGKLASATAEQKDRLIQVRNNQAEGAKLLLELESAQSVYKRALDGYDQIKAAAGGQYSNVSLLSQASVPVKSTRPNKLKLLALATFLSIGLGLAAPLLYELVLNRRVRSADDVERDLGIPVLAEFDASAAPAPGSVS